MNLKNLVINLVGKHECPREIEFVNSFPLTTTSKTQRRILREREIEKMNEGK